MSLSKPVHMEFQTFGKYLEKSFAPFIASAFPPWVWLCLTLAREDNQKALSLCQETHINSHEPMHANTLSTSSSRQRRQKQRQSQRRKQRARLFGLQRWRAYKMSWLQWRGQRSSVLVLFHCVCDRVYVCALLVMVVFKYPFSAHNALRRPLLVFIWKWRTHT